jgi:hypothetical protein
MTTYTAYFRTDSQTARCEVKASTPKRALAKARKLYEDDPSDLWFEPYDDGMPVNEITVCDAGGEELAAWLDEELRLRLAASDLLAALERAVDALNTAPRFRVGDTDSYDIASLCDRAIAQAKAGAGGAS